METVSAAGMGLVGIIAMLIGIGALVCWIMEIIAAFKHGDGPLMGILSIVLCGLGGFIIGWIYSGKWGIRNLMIIWSILYVVSLVLQIVGGGFAALSGAALEGGY